MAETDDLLESARKGAEAWNQWRSKNPRKRADFSGVDFTLDENREICFEGFIFDCRANFKGATFGDNISFKGAGFREGVCFERATFGSKANFDSVQFGQDPDFQRVIFGTNAYFGGANFGDGTIFKQSIFNGNVDFGGGPFFSSISFSETRFQGTALFVGRKFGGEADFSDATFHEPPDFRATEHHENLDWTGVRFGFSGVLRIWRLRIPIKGWTINNNTVARLRRLRGLAKEIHAVDAERDLFILERQAERGILWYNWWRGDWRARLTDWWRPLTATVLMFLYRWSSNCGRSFLLPVFWLAVSNWGFYNLYAFLIDQPLCLSVKKAIFDLAFASAVPFGATARPAFQSAVKELFRQANTETINIPWQIQTASAAQGITNLVLLFLLGLALRNYFKFR